MGPVRGLLTAFAAALPAAPAWADVCAKLRHNWSPAQGRTTTLGEIWHSLAAPGLVTLAMVCVIVAALTLRSVALSLLAFISCSLWVAFQLSRHDGAYRLAQQQGCIGPDLGVMALPAALLILTLIAIGLAHRAQRQGEG